MPLSRDRALNAMPTPSVEARLLAAQTAKLDGKLHLRQLVVQNVRREGPVTRGQEAALTAKAAPTPMTTSLRNARLVQKATTLQLRRPPALSVLQERYLRQEAHRAPSASSARRPLASRTTVPAAPLAPTVLKEKTDPRNTMVVASAPQVRLPLALVRLFAPAARQGKSLQTAVLVKPVPRGSTATLV